MNAALARTRSASASASVAKHRRRRVETRARRSAIENDDADVRVVLEEDASVTRRKAIMVTTSALAAMVMTPRANRSSYESNEYAFAAESTIDNKMTMYTDDILKFSLSYPTDSWELLVGETGGSGDRSGSRQVIAFAPKNANPKDVNISLVATPVGADFQKMGSFGSAFEFGFNLVNPMNRPRVRKGREDQVQYCELIDAVSKGSNYFVEYNLTRPSTGIDSKQLVVAGIGYDGRVSHLYSTTAQMPRNEEEKWRPEIEKILDSLVLPPTLYN